MGQSCRDPTVVAMDYGRLRDRFELASTPPLHLAAHPPAQGGSGPITGLVKHGDTPADFCYDSSHAKFHSREALVCFFRSCRSEGCANDANV
jgi:hypothetical protein